MELRNNTAKHMVVVNSKSGMASIYYLDNLPSLRNDGLGHIAIYDNVNDKKHCVYHANYVSEVFWGAPFSDLSKAYPLVDVKPFVAEKTAGEKQCSWIATVYMDGMMEPEVIEFKERPSVCDEGVAFVTFADDEKQANFKADKVDRFFVECKG